MVRLVLMILSLMSPSVIFAVQLITLKEGVATPVTIGINALNHIVVVNDRIVSVKSDKYGAFEHDMDEKLGHIYIKPVLGEYPEPIQLFLTTEKERMLSLLLVPGPIMGESIRLSVEGSNKVDNAWEKSSHYEKVITKIIKSMHKRELLENFQVSDTPKNEKKTKLKNKLVMYLEAVYKGEDISGEIWRVENETDKMVSLDASDFHERSVLAVAIRYVNLNSKASTIVYRVVKHG